MHTRFFLSIFAIFLFNCQVEEGVPEESGSLRAFNLAMGNPTNATADVKNENNYLMESTQYSLSYNRSRATPNWVSWYLGAAWLGAVDRQDDFRADTRLPAGWYRVLPTNYSASGFDRGHNCPSGDRTKTAADNSATFLMTNMIPQAPGNNQGPWSQLEQYSRKLVEQGNELYIIMGSYGTGGTGSAGFKEKISNGRITVPRSVWKVILVLPKGSDDLNRVNKDTRVIAVDIPNRHDVSGLHWADFRVPVDDIEAAAKVDVLSALPATVQNSIEAKTDKGPIN